MLDIKQYLKSVADKLPNFEQKETLQFPDATIDVSRIKLIMISEVVPSNPADYFYSRNPDAAFMSTTIPIFNSAGADVKTIDEIIDMGVYITTASKIPKDGYTIPTQTIKDQLPILEAELDLFPNLKVIMLMGDVAKMAFNTIARSRTGKSVIPSESTYKIRGNEYYYGAIRVFPSYIITGGNILIEKSKVDMINGDLIRSFELIK